MKKAVKIWKMLLFVLVFLVVPGIWVSAKENRELKVVFTHDLHSHLEPFYLEENGEERSVGGFARMMTYLKQQRAEEENLLFLDGGDFSMGTLYQTNMRHRQQSLGC